ADESEQFDEALPHGGALIGRQRCEEIEQSPERVVHMTTGDVEVGDGELRLHVERCSSCRGSRLLKIEALHAVEQPHLAESRASVLVTRVLRERLLVSGDSRRE